jgi:GT2 family glycosyltransferase
LLGPGGARNRLIAAAQHELVANFDDDSFPDQPDYFARVLRLAREFPDAAMYSAASQDFEKAMPGPHAIAVSSGCGCIFRKSWHSRTRGFVPLPIAYGMEETDISLQLHALSGAIVHAPDLHVRHDKPPPVEVSALLNATVIANMALLPYLRYPVMMWPAGFWQVLRRVIYAISSGWPHGVWAGIQLIPSHLLAHRSEIARVSYRSLLSWFVLRLRPRPLSPLPIFSSPTACP